MPVLWTKNGTSVKRFRMAAKVTDKSGFVDITLFTDDVLTIMQCVGHEPSSELNLEALDEKLSKLRFVLGMRHAKKMTKAHTAMLMELFASVRLQMNWMFLRMTSQTPMQLSLATNPSGNWISRSLLQT